MKTQAEVEKELLRIEEEMKRPSVPMPMTTVYYATRISALRWVLGQQDKEADNDAS